MRRRADPPGAAPAPWPALSPPDSLCLRLAEYSDALVSDDGYAPHYGVAVKRQPSVSPPLLVLAVLLPFRDDRSDREPKMRLRFDPPWNLSLGLGLEDTGSHTTMPCLSCGKLPHRG